MDEATGLLARLTPEQREAAFRYDGPERSGCPKACFRMLRSRAFWVGFMEGFSGPALLFRHWGTRAPLPHGERQGMSGDLLRER
jgi:hypothetical protein